MRFWYNLLIYVAAPVALLMQLWRGLRDPSYRERLGERFGFGPALAGPTIWIHAVSVGEVQAAEPLVRKLLARHPQYTLVLTTVTPTGAARARQLLRRSRAIALRAVRPAGIGETVLRSGAAASSR